MRAETVHVTEHALLRWRERASERQEFRVDDIIQAVKKSRVIKKNEPLPYPLPRLDGSVYSFNAGVLFILEPVTIDEYRLITVIVDGPKYSGCRQPIKTKRPRKKQKYVEAEMEIDIKERKSSTHKKRQKKSEEDEIGPLLLKILMELKELRTENKRLRELIENKSFGSIPSQGLNDRKEGTIDNVV